jgi:hypothetical protein
MRQFFGGCAAIRYNFSDCIEGNLSRGVVTSVVSEPELKIDALPQCPRRRLDPWRDVVSIGRRMHYGTGVDRLGVGHHALQ